MMLLPFLKGLATGGALIIAIGAQNAFVLSHGIKRHHVFVIPLICSLCDAVLIFIGISGIGSIAAYSNGFQTMAAVGGMVFLLWYGFNAFVSAWNGGSLETDNVKTPTLKTAILTTLAVTLLNPHVYLDTVVLMGTVSSQVQGTVRPLFGAGAVTASFVWFFSLSLGARFLQPVFRKQISWRILDTLVGITMWSLAGSLFNHFLAVS